MAVAEGSRTGAKEITSESLPATGQKVGDRASKIDEMEQKLERLQGTLEGLKKEVKERAIEDAGAGTKDPVCNACLARKKGAALFPCGHTFCWMCTSKLRRGRGPCPVCGHYFWNVLSINAEVSGN